MSSYISNFHEVTTDLRRNAYQANFFLPDNNNGVERPFFPTSLNEQYLFLESYNSGYEGLHDLYSIIYKPVVITLLTCQLALQGVSSLCRGVSKLSFLPNSVIEKSDLNSKDNESETKITTATEFLVRGLGQLLVAGYLGAVWLTVDTVSSALSLVCRTLATLLGAGSEYMASAKDDSYEPAFDND